MKRLAVAAASVLLMLGTAQAQTSPLYGELGYTVFKFKGGGFDANPHGIRGIVGYEFHPNVAVEGMLAFGVKSDDGTFDDGFGPVNSEVKLRHAYGVFVKPKYAFGNAEVFGRLGWNKIKSKFRDTVGGVVVDEGSDSDSDFAYGLGVNYKFNPRMSVNLDYMRYFDKDGGKIDGWTIGVGYRF